MPLDFEAIDPPISANSSVKFGGYRMKQFVVPLSRVGSGNYLSDLINQFLALNQNLSVVGVTNNWRRSAGRAEALLYTLIYREGGARHYAEAFQSTASQSAEDLASSFFSLNPAFRPMYTTIVSPPNDVPSDKKIVVIYQSMNDFARLCLMDSSPGAPYEDVPVAGFGDMQDPINPNRADVLAVNLGNDVWPDGGVNLLFNNVDACPDATAACCFGGIAPCCEDAASIAENPEPTIIELCAGCYPADLLTFTTSTTIPTQTTVPTTTQSTTETYPTTTTSTTQPTPPTTTTTTTPPPCTSGVSWVGLGGVVGTCALNNYTLVGGVPTITLYFNSCSSVYMTLTFNGVTWVVTGYPTICPVSVVSHSESNLDCSGGSPTVNITLALGAPCNNNPSDTISVP
jgi:hypothetical protein